MKVFAGSVIVLLLVGAGIWLLLSPSFQKIGETAVKVKENFKEEENGENTTDEKSKTTE